MWTCSSLGLRQYLLEILKSNYPLMHINLFVFESASHGYLARLNRSLVEGYGRYTLRVLETFTRPGALLSCTFTRPGTAVFLRWKGQKLIENHHPAGWLLPFITPPGRVRCFGAFFCHAIYFLWKIKGKNAKGSHILHLLPPTLTHTAKNTLRERIEDRRLPVGRLKLSFRRIILIGVS